MNKQRIINLLISTGTYNSFIDEILKLAKRRQSSYVCVTNVHMLVEAHKDKQFEAIVNNADMATPDGMPIAKSFILLHGKNQTRVAGMTLLPHLLSASEADPEMNVYFYGGTQDMLDKTVEYCKDVYPGLTVGGAYSPPFRPLSDTEVDEIAQMINQSGANLVFVALGCPKQERWMASMKGKVNACMVGIGGALPVMVGMQKRAPKWMQKAALEWLYRLGQEPKRLFKRYAVTNSIFAYLLLGALIKRKKA